MRSLSLLVAFLFLTGLLEGCNPTPPANQWDGGRGMVLEAWELPDEFAAWPVVDRTPSGGRVYAPPGQAADPKRGPALLSETVAEAPADRSLRDLAAAEYTSRPGGKIGKVFVDEPNRYVFEALYRDNDAVPFRSVCRLSRQDGKLAVLTYFRRADELSDRDLTDRADLLAAARLRP